MYPISVCMDINLLTEKLTLPCAVMGRDDGPLPRTFAADIETFTPTDAEPQADFS